MAADKPHLNLAVIGHIDHGKSTTVGRLMFETGAVPPHIIENYRKEAESKGKGSFEFAWVMDNLKEERERGITIDIAHKRFDTAKFYFTVVDCPGHRDFVKNMITGASQADAAVLVVAAPDGVMEQTKEHVFLARTLGINQLIVAINKMDVINYDQKRFEEVKKDLSGLMQMVGYKPAETLFIPMSSFKGANISKKSPRDPLVHRPHPPRGPRHAQGAREAHGQAPPGPDPGRLLDLGHRHRAGRPGRDGHHEEGDEGLVHARQQGR